MTVEAPRVGGVDFFASEHRREQIAEREVLEVFASACSSGRATLSNATRALASSIQRLPGPISIMSLMRGGAPVGAAVTQVCQEGGPRIRHGLLGWVRGESTAIRASGIHASSAVVVAIDGWTGSGSTMREFRARWQGPPLVTAALADPAMVCDIAGTTSDVLVPHAMLGPASAMGFGRVHRTASGELRAYRSSPRTSLANYYMSVLGAQLASGTGDAPSDLPLRRSTHYENRSAVRCGVNECWRAYVRGELVELMVSANAYQVDEGSLVPLIDRLGDRWYFGDTGGYQCIGFVDEAVSPVSAR